MSDESPDQSDSSHTEGASGFSTAEKAVGAWAAYEHPLISGAVANHMLNSETSPTRRRQLTKLRNAAFVWWAVGLTVALIGVIVVASFASTMGAGGDCKGGPDKTDPMSTTYQSSDNKHWTATYPCVNGGSTTIPIPRRDVPGGG